MISVLKLTGGPGSIQFLLIAILIGLAVLYFAPKRRRMAILWLLTVIGLYLVISMPVVAHAITARLPAVSAPDTSPPIGALIVLDGDNRRGRVRSAQAVMAAQRLPDVRVLGTHWILDALNEAGVDGHAYKVDGSAGNTLAQMQQVATIAANVREAKVVVIASRLQAPRVAALAAALKTRAVVLPSPVDDEPPAAGLRKYVPTYLALRVSRDALYEHAALWWYERQGWIGPPQTASIR